MGRAPRRKNSLVPGHPALFTEQEIPILEKPEEKDFRSLKTPLWTENKAKLIQEYIRLFTFVTKHGTYIDGFAAPQQRHLKELCSANLVLQARPPWMREFWLCDLDPKGIELLEEIKAAEALPKRRIEVLPGDFNERVHDILGAGTITPKTATFALLDQRGFECDWATVQAIAGHKTTHKIEIFYFLATGWLDRSIAAVRRPETAERLTRWWGRDDWRDLRKVSSAERGPLLAERFMNELGYAYAKPYPIHSQRRGGRIMYHMIHATDHKEATPLMLRAYRKTSGRTLDDKSDQSDLEALLAELRETDALDESAPTDPPIEVTTRTISGGSAEPDPDAIATDAATTDLDRLVADLEGDAEPTFGSDRELELRAAMGDAVAGLAAALEARRPKHGEMGHNGPPVDDDGNPLPESLVAEIKDASAIIAEEAAKAEPDALDVAKAASRLQKLLHWFQPRIDIFADEFAKKAGGAAGAATVAGAGIACAALIPPLHAAISASAHWIATVLAAQ
ncbi:three-Cys-motif partner protein TcmP [Sphingomonas oryzagri]|uniref:Three-Cys-motif partner protein TcmP n=1 Tax=Sphingomonas oryzagri TaxID=3042314 RepID=A0ABT6N3V0_9SPHN|nr:three-Cys-motif partner protein TcmP [Sphingomonas oryzagri]MDH7639976.1 three-Cys-motif partner protein TcmP [Sphingomonas oryzagri]